MGTTMVSIRVPDESLAKIDEGARRLKTSRSQLMVTGALALLVRDTTLTTQALAHVEPAVPSVPSLRAPEPATPDASTPQAVDYLVPEPDKIACAHPRDRREKLGYMTRCGVCGAKVS